jgi:hypothetical protein
MPGSLTTRSPQVLAITHPGVAFRFLNNVGTPDLPAFRGSIAGLHIFPTDASRPVSRPTVHGLGLIWVATP